MQPGDAGAEPPVAKLAHAAMAKGLDSLAINDSASALRWLERAHRLVPNDPSVALALAGAHLSQSPARALPLFQDIAETYDICQAWLGAAHARLRLSGLDDAAEPLAAALSRHAFTPTLVGLADKIGFRPGSPGWCALHSDGRLEIRTATPGQVRILLDGKPLRGTRLPANWPVCQTIDVRIDNVPLLGSPIQITAIRRLVGCVEVRDGGISGWAWHPGDPHCTPSLTLLHPSRRLKRNIVARDESIKIPNAGPLARPRSFWLTRAELADTPGLVCLRGPDGRDLPGSPLDPLSDEAAHVAGALQLGTIYAASRASRPRTIVAAPSVLRADGPIPLKPVGANARIRQTTVIIPVHNGGAAVLACLHSVLTSLPRQIRILVIDDGSSDPFLVAALDDLVRRGKINMIRHERASGFPAAVNAGIGASSGRDVVLLNSDTLVPVNWLQRLRAAAYADRDIGTVTPLSNDASILSYPNAAKPNSRPDQKSTDQLDRAAERANGSTVADIPVGVGFCLYLRRDCLDAVGLFRADLFAQGYGEENDFCLRARRLGWRNVALTGLFVGHLGGASFGSSAVHLRARNSRILEQQHPGYAALIDDYLARDPLAEPRRRIDLLRWRERERKWRRCAILITHNDGGGVEQRLSRTIKAHAQAGRRPIVLRPAKTANGEPAITIRDGIADDLPNLIYAVPQELAELVRLLRRGKPEMVEAHHLADYPMAVYDLIAQLNVPYDTFVHDYAWFCPRVSLVGTLDRYCGEPDLPGCEACVADNGHFLQEEISVAALRRRSATFLSGARRVVVPSEDTGTRMRRHFAGLITTTVPHEDDTAFSPSSMTSVRRCGRARVCVVGGIGVHKGYDIILACARDAAQRDLNLEFVVVGHTIDDDRMLATGRVFVTGRFEPDEAVRLISEQNTRLGFISSICPETWCLSLNDIWRAGLQAAAFDIGAPAERIRRTGRGILLPLGLSASAINNRLIAAISTAEIDGQHWKRERKKTD